MRLLLQEIEQLDRLGSRPRIGAGLVIFEEGVDDERLRIERFAPVNRVAAKIGDHEIAAVGPVVKVIANELVAPPRGCEVIPLRITQALDLRVRETPKHTGLRHQHLVHGGTPAEVGIGEDEPAVRAVHRRVVPIGKHLGLEVILHLPRPAGEAFRRAGRRRGGGQLEGEGQQQDDADGPAEGLNVSHV